MLMKKKILFVIFIATTGLLSGHHYPKDFFRSPVDFKMTLSGNFGELRKNHFHSGIDIKTGGVIGKKIYAVADGHISRIKVSPNGFGKAIYIRHNNGYTSVYGHLNRFNENIAKWVKSQQYERESFGVDLYPTADQFVFEQGEIIAFSGNSGGSDGPHLHFEIRETKTEKPINPLLFAFEIEDQIRPKITRLKIYPLNEQALINGKNNALEFKTEGGGLAYRLKQKETINVSGEIGFGLISYDLLNDTYNKNGIYSIELFIDSNLIYSHKLDKFSFSETKYINSLIDYAHYIDHKQRYQRSLLDEGNRLSTIQTTLNNGKVLFNDSLKHSLIYEIKDAYGNTSRLMCELQSDATVKTDTIEKNIGENYFKFDEENYFENEDVKLKFRTKTFYQSLNFEFSKTNAEKGMYSDVCKIHKPQVPVHRPFQLEIKTKNISYNLISKALIVNIDNGKPNPIGGVIKDGFIKAFSRQLGTFTVMLDTLAPEIIALNIHQGKKINGYKKISFKVTDDLSGIKSYRGTLNGEWILMEFDPKNDRLTYFIDERMKSGKNTISLEVLDDRDNSSTFNADVFY